MPRSKRCFVAMLMLVSVFWNASCSMQSVDDESQGEAVANEKQSRKPAPFVRGKNDWPQFRGPAGVGISDATGLPVKWSEKENIAWKTTLPGAGASSPIVFGDHIYLTSYTGFRVPGESGGSLDELKRHLICVRRDDGKILWNQSVKAKLPEKDRIRDHGYAANTPATDAERV